MSKCLCYKCDFSVIREWERKTELREVGILGIHIHCNWSNTDIINEEAYDKKNFFTEKIIKMTCNRFDDKKSREQKSKKS